MLQPVRFREALRALAAALRTVGRLVPERAVVCDDKLQQGRIWAAAVLPVERKAGMLPQPRRRRDL